MDALALGLMLIGTLIALVGYIWVAVIAFQDHWGWGIGCLCCGIVQLIYAIQNWDDAGKPFLIMVGGSVMANIGSFMLESGGAGM